jgi:GNAT superfamily N-acetyltransferase
MEVRMAVPSDGASIKELMKGVFEEDPLMRWFILGDDRHAQAMEIFYAFMVERYCMPRGLVWVTKDLSGAALWMPPGKWDIPPKDLPAMVGVIIKAFGWKGVFKKFSERQRIDGLHPKAPHYYLSGLGVQESLRGKGLGSALIRPCLERADAEGMGCYLETTLPRNLPFYERHGFKTTGELRIGLAGIPVWLMWRDPQKRLT